MENLRQKLTKEIEELNALIEKSENQIYLKQIELLQINDEISRYEEKIEDVYISRRPKKIEKKLIGRIFWTDHFVDEDTNEVIGIDRQRIVREDNKWIL